MPNFRCDVCNKNFSSKKKLEVHQKKKHGGKQTSRDKKPFFTKKKIVTVFFAVIMIGLPLGGGIFFASFNGDAVQQDVIEEGEVPDHYILEEPIPGNQQEYLMTQGGTRRMGDFYPSLILQYSCDDCPETVENLTMVVEEFNQNERYVYLAPYPDMSHEIVLSGLHQDTTYEDVNTTKIKEDVCRKLDNNPITCLEDVFS